MPDPETLPADPAACLDRVAVAVRAADVAMDPLFAAARAARDPVWLLALGDWRERLKLVGRTVSERAQETATSPEQRERHHAVCVAIAQRALTLVRSGAGMIAVDCGCEVWFDEPSRVQVILSHPRPEALGVELLGVRDVIDGRLVLHEAAGGRRLLDGSVVAAGLVPAGARTLETEVAIRVAGDGSRPARDLVLHARIPISLGTVAHRVIVRVEGNAAAPRLVGSNADAVQRR